MSSIRNQLLIINLNISCWEGRKQDRKVSAEVAKSHAVSSSVGRYHKDLLPDADAHRAILKIRNAWRVWHAENTLPWGDNGARVIRSAGFMDYAAGYRGFKDLFDAACQNFYNEYPKLVAEAEFKLNTLFDAQEYPSVLNIKDKFRATMGTYPLPNADDFRIIEGISPEEAEQLRTQAVNGLNEQVTQAVKDLWGRLHLVVQNMSERLQFSDDGKPLKFHDSLVDNMRELLDRVPQLNLTGDPEIKRYSSEMQALLAFGPETLRNDIAVRSEVSAKAAELAKRMKCFV